MLGAIASLTLVIYGIYLLALVKVIPVTMTLPGIAGLVLTIGVAADANIVIFERIKEEVRAGRSTGAAIQAGYRKGITAIVDANIVTLLVAFVLFILATAGVKGFALMLGLGVIVSLFTAVLATQAILYLLRGTRLLRSRSALGAGEQRAKFRYDYMGASKWFFSASGIILLIGALAIAGRGINFGIDFESGTRIIASLERTATVDDVRGALTADGYADAKIQTIDNPELGRNVVQVSTPTLEPPEVDTVNRTLDERFGLAQDPEVTSIGPTFGETVARSALIAIIASLSIISLYIALRFEWKFAVPVLIAADARHPDRLGRLRAHRPGGDDGDGGGVADHPGLLALRHDHRARPRARERAADAERDVLPDHQPVAVGGHRPVAGHELLHAAAGAGADALRRRDAARLRLRAAGRHRLRRVLLDLHRDADPVLLEGARPRLRDAAAARPRRLRGHRARLRRRDRGRARRRRAQGAPGPAPLSHRADRSRAGRLAARSSTTWCATSASRRRRSRNGRSRRSPAPRGRPAGGAPAAATGGNGAGDPSPRDRRRRSRAARAATRQAQEAAQQASRAAALMAMLVWIMVGLALWHFSVFLPDHFWGGIVGAFVGALIGSVVFALIVNLGSVPGQDDTTLLTGLQAVPGALLGMAAVYFEGQRRERAAH